VAAGGHRDRGQSGDPALVDAGESLVRGVTS